MNSIQNSQNTLEKMQKKTEDSDTYLHTVSLVFPIFNEEKNIPILYEQVTDLLNQESSYMYEFIFVDDGSKDRSWQIITELAHLDERVKGVKLSRNFGHQTALMAGYHAARGAAIISMDADLEHPPHMISAMIEQWKCGYKIVYVQREQRNDAWLKRIAANWYYRFLCTISDISIPAQVADFRLIDRCVLNVIAQSKNSSLYLRGAVAWTGFSHTILKTEYGTRTHGHSGYTWKKMFLLACNGITGFSLFPLKIAAFMGVFVIASGSAMFAYITIDALYFQVHYPLFKWLVTIIYIFMGIHFLLLWVLGEYIGRMYEQEQNRPLYVVEEMRNIEKEQS